MPIHRNYTDHTAPADQWAAIISLADKWQFEKMYAAACEAYLALPNVPTMDKIVLCQTYDIPTEQLLGLYVQICTRPKSLSIEEGQAVGLETLTLISQTREEIKQRLYQDNKVIVRNNLIDRKPSYYHC